MRRPRRSKVLRVLGMGTVFFPRRRTLLPRPTLGSIQDCSVDVSSLMLGVVVVVVVVVVVLLFHRICRCVQKHKIYQIIPTEIQKSNDGQHDHNGGR